MSQKRPTAEDFSRSRDQDEHADEARSVREQADHAPKDDGSNWQPKDRVNDVVNHLEQQDDRTADAVLKYKLDISAFDDNDQKAVIGSIVNGFNNTQFDSQEEKKLAAEKLTGQLFDPLDKKIDQYDAAFKVPRDLKDQLGEESLDKMNYIGSGKAADGSITDYFSVNNPEEADQLRGQIEEGGGKAYLIQEHQLLEQKEQFSHILANSGKDQDLSAALLSGAYKDPVANIHGETADNMKNEALQWFNPGAPAAEASQYAREAQGPGLGIMNGASDASLMRDVPAREESVDEGPVSDAGQVQDAVRDDKAVQESVADDKAAQDSGAAERANGTQGLAHILTGEKLRE